VHVYHGFNTLRTGILFLYIYHKLLIQSKVTFLKIRPGGPNHVRFIYCVIKCVKTKRVLKGKFASSFFHSCNAKNANDANLRHRSTMCPEKAGLSILISLWHKVARTCVIAHVYSTVSLSTGA
jgi:hypothetical protein